MALSSSFRERLDQMELTRNQRLILLQAEKEIQVNKSQFLQSKLSNIRSLELRCLKFHHKIASHNVLISSLKSEIDRLDTAHLNSLHQFRVLRSEVEELEELKKEKNRFYYSKTREMEDFKALVDKFAVECRMQVEALRSREKELKSHFMEMQSRNGCLDNSDIADAEMKKSELLAMKEKLDRNLASNLHVRTHLQKQLQRILISQNGDSK